MGDSSGIKEKQGRYSQTKPAHHIDLVQSRYIMLLTIRPPLLAIIDGLALMALIDIHDMLAVGIAVEEQIGIVGTSRIAMQGPRPVSPDIGHKEREPPTITEIPLPSHRGFLPSRWGLAICWGNKCSWAPLL